MLLVLSIVSNEANALVEEVEALAVEATLREEVVIEAFDLKLLLTWLVKILSSDVLLLNSVEMLEKESVIDVFGMKMLLTSLVKVLVMGVLLLSPAETLWEGNVIGILVKKLLLGPIPKVLVGSVLLLDSVVVDGLIDNLLLLVALTNEDETVDVKTTDEDDQITTNDDGVRVDEGVIDVDEQSLQVAIVPVVPLVVL